MAPEVQDVQDVPGIQIDAIRQGVAFTELASYCMLRLPGRTARAALQRVCPLELSLRDGQVQSTLFLQDDARPLADVLICQQKDGLLLLAEGPTPTALAAHLTTWTEHPVEVLNGTERLFALTGPYAWELLGRLVGADVYALPPLFHHRFGRLVCVRASKTGEYFYLLIVQQDEAADFLSQLTDQGAALDLVRVEEAALMQCALESGHFNIQREGKAAGVTPLELQLQWRVSYCREYKGAAALRARHQQGIKRRLTTLLAPDKVAIGDAVVLGDAPIGVIVNAGFCVARRAFVALALLDRPYAVSGIDRYAAVHAGAAVPLRSVSPPVICQRSLFITPGQHSYRHRAEYTFPPL